MDAVTAKEISEVDRESEQLEKALAGLGECIGELESRLRAVLRSEPPTKEGEDKAEKKTLVPHADWIRSRRYSVENFHSQVVGILARLEL